MPLGSTDDRSAQGIINAIQSTYGQSITANQINPVALSMLQAKLPNGRYLIRSPRLRFNLDAFNIFNHPDFDAPNNNVTFFPNRLARPSLPPVGSLGIIQHTIGSPRFLQLSLHLAF